MKTRRGIGLRTRAAMTLFLATFLATAALAQTSDRDRILEERGFLLTPSGEASLFDLYEEDEHTLLTTDLLLHAWHRVFDTSSRIADIEFIRPALADLSRRMVEASRRQARDAGEFADLARANAAYFAVGAALLDEDYEVPDGLEPLVETDVAQARRAGGLAESDLMAYGTGATVTVDFSLFRPRGRYTRTPELEQLFRALMWYSRVPFYLDAKGDAPIRRAFLVVQALYGDPDALAAWRRLDAYVTFLAGPWDDSSPEVFADILNRTLGGLGAPDDLAGERWESLRAEVGRLPMPHVDSEPEMGKHRLFTFLGQRLTLDEWMIDEVVDPKIPGRYLPSVLDVAYALGSDRAGELPVDPDPARGGDPAEGRVRARALADTWPKEIWRGTIAGSWLLAIRGLYHRPDGEVQEFVKNPDWDTKLVQTGAAAWTEMRHDLVAFIRPHYLTMGITIPDQRPRWWTYVEPYPGVFDEIAGACERWVGILEEFDVESDAALASVRSLAESARQFGRIARDELAGRPIEAEEHDWVRLWPIRNKWLTQAPAGYEHLFTRADKRMALVVDVAHALDPGSGRAVLEEAVGDPARIVALGRFGDEEVKLVGGAFTHFEFVAHNRPPMTDEEWQAIQSETPRPAYTQGLFTEEKHRSARDRQILAIGEPFPGFYSYSEPQIGPDDSV